MDSDEAPDRFAPTTQAISASPAYIHHAGSVLPRNTYVPHIRIRPLSSERSWLIIRIEAGSISMAISMMVKENLSEVTNQLAAHISR